MNHIVHAEIAYIGKDCRAVHSDICPPECSSANMNDHWKQLVRECLEEFLDNFDGRGEFYVKGYWASDHLNPNYSSSSD